MPSGIKANKDVGIIEVRSYGDVSLDDLRRQIPDVRRTSEDTGMRKVFVDTTDEESLPATFDLLDFMSKLPRELAYATYSRTRHATHEDMKFAETVALNRGICVQHFVDRDTAIAWLLAQPFPQSSPNKPDAHDGN